VAVGTGVRVGVVVGACGEGASVETASDGATGGRSAYEAQAVRVNRITMEFSRRDIVCNYTSRIFV
jgi:hypothetical protein